jgi:hypothetical protein
MDQSGPEGKGKETGRGLGKCRNQEQETLLNKLGKGLGLKRKSGGGIGKKKRLKSGE